MLLFILHKFDNRHNVCYNFFLSTSVKKGKEKKMKKSNKSNEIPLILNKFLKYLENVKNYSKNTIKEYSIDLMVFFRFLKKYHNLDIGVKEFNVFILAQTKESDVIAFMIYLNQNRDNTAVTRERKMASIRCFFKWLLNNYPSNSQWTNPTNNLPSIKKIQRTPKYLTLSQAKRIQSIFNIYNSNYPRRNNMIITLFLNTGLRVSELSNLNISDINFREKYIRLIGKGNKESKIFISEKLKEELLNYLKIENNNNEIIEINKPVFVSHQNTRLGVRAIETICKNAYNLMGLEEKNYTAHTLRHTFGTIMYKQLNGDILLLKEIMRHSSIEATQIYVHAENNEIREAFNKNPLNEIFSKVA